jgi:hypothetical protein
MLGAFETIIFETKYSLTFKHFEVAIDNEEYEQKNENIRDNKVK